MKKARVITKGFLLDSDGMPLAIGVAGVTLKLSCDTGFGVALQIGSDLSIEPTAEQYAVMAGMLLAAALVQRKSEGEQES